MGMEKSIINGNMNRPKNFDYQTFANQFEESHNFHSKLMGFLCFFSICSFVINSFISMLTERFAFVIESVIQQQKQRNPLLLSNKLKTISPDASMSVSLVGQLN